MFNTFGQQKTDHLWYKDKLLRIYHPNMKNWEVTGFDVASFVENCVAVNAEAIVVNAGGIYSFYPSKIEQPVRTEAVEFSPDGNYLLLLSFEESDVLSLLVFKSSYADRNLYMELQKKPLNLLKLLNL